MKSKLSDREEQIIWKQTREGRLLPTKMHDDDRTFVFPEDKLMMLNFDKKKKKLIINFIGIPHPDILEQWVAFGTYKHHASSINALFKWMAYCRCITQAICLNRIGAMMIERAEHTLPQGYYKEADIVYRQLNSPNLKDHQS